MKTLFIAQTKTNRRFLQQLNSTLRVETPEFDLDTVDVSCVHVVLLGDIDFLGQLVGRLGARYGNTQAFFTYIVPPCLCTRLADINHLLNWAGLADRCNVRIPSSGYWSEVRKYA